MKLLSFPHTKFLSFVPAKAGTQKNWFPACAGMSGNKNSVRVTP